MMVGVVQSDLEAVISIAVIEPSGRHQVVEAVIDTGYNGFLTLAYWDDRAACPPGQTCTE